MSSGIFEFDDRGRKLFKPNVPFFPSLDEVHDLLDPAMASVREFDRRLGAWNRDIEHVQKAFHFGGMTAR